MGKALVIVESPAKAKTIEGYLGKDFTVASSYGHVRDLPKEAKAIDIEHGFKPTYEISKDKTEIIKNLKKLVKEVDTVYLASDDDREGEAISWHLKEVLGLADNQTRRIVFREITKKAIQNALQNPRNINFDLVNSQQARRVLDRLVGYELSPILWRKIKTGLSAGRVQSVAVRLVVEREREIDSFKSKSSFRVTALFNIENGKTLKAELPERFETEDEAYKFLEKCNKGKFSIKSLEKKPAKKSPSPPFTTSTLQQEASRKLGYSVAQTMRIAQKLYEEGKISYMRTDSVTLSEDAITGASNAIENSYGKNYLKVRQYKTKNDSAQEAHEAIRPTDFTVQSTGDERNEQKLYELIWKRAISSQMEDAKIERTIATIEISSVPQAFVATGEVVVFDGFLKVYSESSDDEDEENQSMLPPLKEGQVLQLNEIRSRQVFTRPPARYTEASLVKKLEELGIGRPSTYAPTISTIQKRDYVVRENREGKEREYKEIILDGKNKKLETETKKEIVGNEKSKLFPTNVAMIVNDFLTSHFNNIVDYSFTAIVEKEFDEIAQGKKKWDRMIGEFYKEFHPKVEETVNIDRAEIGKARELGVDPQSGKKVTARLGRFGAIVQIGESTDEEKPRYARLRKDQFIESITFEEAMELFKLPRDLGEYEGLPMTVAIGRFGPYIRHGDKFCSLTKEDDPMTIQEERAIELIEAKRKSDAERTLKTFPENPEVQILKGRWGPFLKVGRDNIKIPKGKTVEELTLQDCLDLAASAPGKKAPAKKGSAKAAKEKPEKKTTAKKSEVKTEAKTKAAKTAKKKAAAKTTTRAKAKTVKKKA